MRLRAIGIRVNVSKRGGGRPHVTEGVDMSSDAWFPNEDVED